MGLSKIVFVVVIGVTIGISFAVSMILGPVLNGWIGVPGIFWLTGLLAVSRAEGFLRLPAVLLPLAHRAEHGHRRARG